MIRKRADELDEYSTNYMRTEVVEKIKRRTYVNRADFEKNGGLAEYKTWWEKRNEKKS
jgi:hypothetical protein